MLTKRRTTISVDDDIVKSLRKIAVDILNHNPEFAQTHGFRGPSLGMAIKWFIAQYEQQRIDANRLTEGEQKEEAPS